MKTLLIPQLFSTFLNRFSVHKSRLVREDDNDVSDDEKRIDMSVHLDNTDRDRHQNYFNEEEPAPEDDEWENQQIRKGVTGVAVVSSQPSPVLPDSQQSQTLFSSVIAPQNKELPTPQAIVQKLRERYKILE